MHLKIPYSYLLLIPLLSFVFGFGLNTLCMTVNHSQMPVLVPGGNCDLLSENDFFHSCMTKASHLQILADRFYIKDMGVASLGDFFEMFFYKFWDYLLVLWIGLIIRDATYYT